MLLAVFSAATILATGCSPAATSPPPTPSAASEETTAGVSSLEEYLDSDSKIADFVLTSDDLGQGSIEMTGTVWVDGRKFRYTINEPGKPLREVISPDGEKAYFVFHDRQVCEPSVAAVDRYLAEFSKPDATSTEDGTDDKTGAKRIVFKVEELDDLSGADNAWWTEDIVFLVKDNVVIGVLTHGNASDGGRPKTFRETRRMFTNVMAGSPIPAERFELPYPVEEAK
jgi:hypothetical protein